MKMKSFVLLVIVLTTFSCMVEREDGPNETGDKGTTLVIADNESGNKVKYWASTGEVDVPIGWWPLPTSFYVTLECEQILDARDLSITYAIKNGSNFSKGDTIQVGSLNYQRIASYHYTYENQYEQTGGNLIVEHFTKEAEDKYIISLRFDDFRFSRIENHSKSFTVTGKANYQVHFVKAKDE